MNADKLKEEVLNYIRFDKPGIEKLLKKCEDLYVEDDGIIDFKSEEEWNEEYFYELFPATRKNFSREKVMELLKVHDKVRGKVKEDDNSKKYTQNNYSTKKTSFNNMDSEKLKEEVLNYIRFDKPGIEKLLRKCEDLYVPDDGIIDFKSEKEWNEKYFYELFPATRKNFSREKVKELLKVHDKIRGKVKEKVENYYKEKKLKRNDISNNTENVKSEGFSIKIFNYEITIKKNKNRGKR